jgi:hypothetical protein
VTGVRRGPTHARETSPREKYERSYFQRTPLFLLDSDFDPRETCPVGTIEQDREGGTSRAALDGSRAIRAIAWAPVALAAPTNWVASTTPAAILWRR